MDEIYITQRAMVTLCVLYVLSAATNTVRDMLSSLTPQSKWSISPYDSLVPMQSGKNSKQFGPDGH